ncbi:MAG: DNA primase [Thermodesulfobacteriota bacterium]
MSLPVRGHKSVMATSYPSESVRRVKEAADIVEVVAGHVALKRTGGSYKGLCPFHGEKTPSFVVHRERGFYHCFGCGEGGDVIAFVMKQQGLSFPEAVRELAQRFHVPLPAEEAGDDGRERRLRAALYEANRKAAELFRRLLLGPPGAAGRRYLAERGIPGALGERFGLGFVPDRWDTLVKEAPRLGLDPETLLAAGLVSRHETGRLYDRFRGRLIFPIFDPRGRVIGFGGRILGPGEPKYLNSPETLVFDKGRTLFGLCQTQAAIRQAGRCVLVEGNFDLLALVAHGIEAVAAPLGTALTRAHLRLLRSHCQELILLFDADAAGLKAALRAVPLVLAEGFEARVGILPAGEDPDTFVRRHGRAGLEACLAAAQPLPEFVCERLVAEHGLSIAGKGRILGELAPLIRDMAQDPIRRSVLVSHVSDRLKLAPDQVLAAVSRPQPQTLPPPRQSAGRQVDLPLQERELLNFLLACPGELDRLAAAGVGAVFSSAAGRAIWEAMQTVRQQEGCPDWSALTLLLGDGPERILVTAGLAAAPAWTPELAAQAAAEMLTRLERLHLRQERDQILTRIQEAQAAANDRLLAELLKAKMALDLRLASPPGAGGHFH